MIKKVSEITYENIAEYLRLTEINENDKQNLETYLEIAINYIENYTGISRDTTKSENLDSFSDFVIVVYILCQDMHDNRCMYVEDKALNNTVKTILDMHTRNNI